MASQGIALGDSEELGIVNRPVYRARKVWRQLRREGSVVARR
jgi:hypothetical protein